MKLMLSVNIKNDIRKKKKSVFLLGFEPESDCLSFSVDCDVAVSVFCPVILSQSSSEILLRSRGASSFSSASSESINGAAFFATGFLFKKEVIGETGVFVGRGVTIPQDYFTLLSRILRRKQARLERFKALNISALDHESIIKIDRCNYSSQLIDSCQ